MMARTALPAPREACPTAARERLDAGALLVDVRELEEVAQVAFDAPGVLLMPMSELAQRFDELPRDRDLVLVSRAGDRSLQAAAFLMDRGYTRVIHMEGGLYKWAVKGLPIKGGRCSPVAAATVCGLAPAVPADVRPH